MSTNTETENGMAEMWVELYTQLRTSPNIDLAVVPYDGDNNSGDPVAAEDLGISYERYDALEADRAGSGDAAVQDEADAVLARLGFSRISNWAVDVGGNGLTAGVETGAGA
jgi:hypothetical protein